MEEEMKVEDEL